MDKSRDQDRVRARWSRTSRIKVANTSMQGQLGHRDEDEELKNADADLSGRDLLCAVRHPRLITVVKIAITSKCLAGYLWLLDFAAIWIVVTREFYESRSVHRSVRRWSR
jgi:hypothetical protein